MICPVENRKSEHCTCTHKLLAIATVLLLAAGVAGAQAPQARLVEGGGAARLELPNGVEFHRTANPVRGLRTVDVRGAAVQLYLWQEQLPSGAVQSFSAVGRDGAQLQGRVRPTTHVVRLRHERFDPLVDGPPAVPPGLAVRAANRLHLVQFEAAPLPEFREDITALGGKVLRFLTDHTFLVEMAPPVRAEVARLSYVRWVGPYHPLFRLDKPLRDAIEGGAPALETQRYSIMLGERGAGRQQNLMGLIASVGGTVELVEPAGLRVEATLTQAQLAEVMHADEVQFVDVWGGPGEVDLNIVRQNGGADYVESVAGYTGQGVRGEVFDSELLTTHQEFSGIAPIAHSNTTSTCSSILHGTSSYSNNFAQGADANSRGVIPDAQGIFFCHAESTQFGGSTSRYDANAELIDPAGPYRAVFQTSSIGSTRTFNYTTISAETDDNLFQNQLLSTQSQSNAGNQDSRPQAWAKNIVSVGGVRHYDTADRCNDNWSFGASIGPAQDGRIKPDLAFYYDSIRSASGSGNTSYTNFGGTSSATPQTSGYFGLLFQMWHDGVWTGHGGGADVFDSRPKMATAKALMVNHAFRYNWTNPGGCAFGDVDRFKQGWGQADAQRLYDRAAVTSVIDESDVIVPLETKSYTATVQAGESELNVSMVYTDPMGTVGAAEHRVNDLSLRVTSPSSVVYWGNNGLTTSNFSSPGGSSNTRDTVENVFVQNPEAGAWTVEVIGDEIVQDAHVETAALDADFALVVSGGLLGACNSTCGNGVIECSETCDGADLGGASCADFGCGGGTLACNASCGGFDTSGCTGCPVCDNDGICELGEDCNTCPGDCASGSTPGASCGNGICEAGDGEDCVSCAADCAGQQNGKPANRFCCGDGDGENPVTCADARCTAGGFACTVDPVVPGTFCCGLFGCESGESCSNCALDCATGAEICDDGVDNDCNGDTDCNDAACSADPACNTSCAVKGESCNIDDDCCTSKCKNGTCR